MKIDYKRYSSYEQAVDGVQKQFPGLTRTEAARKLYDAVPLERTLQDRIMKWIKQEYPQAFVWKATAGAYSRCGIPDICCIVDGQFYGFEVKRPFWGKASKVQLKTMEQIRAAGGVAGLVSYPEDVGRMIFEVMQCKGNASTTGTRR